MPLRRRLSAHVLALVLALVLATATVVANPAGATVAADSPVGHLDSLRLVGGSVVLAGWSLDRDQLSGEHVDVYQTTPNRIFRGHAATTLLRTDVNRALKVSGNHGWTLAVPVRAGAQTWCVYGINIGPGTNALLGCKQLTVPTGHTPIGSVGAALDDGMVTQVHGWALDFDDVRHPEAVDLYRVSPSRAFLRRVYTTLPRPDVNARYRVGGRHGWLTWLPDLAGQAARYCAYAINVGVVTANPQIGCVEVGAGPSAGTISASSVGVTSTTATLTVAVAALAGYPTLRVTRVLGDAEGTDWTAPVVTEVAVPTSRYVSITDTGLVPGTSYRYAFFLHDATGKRTTGYRVTLTTDAAPCTSAVCGWGGIGLGAGPAQPTYARMPVSTAGLNGVTKVAAGMSGGAALTSDGHVWAWGGLAGGTAASPVPVELAGLSGVIDLAESGNTGYAVESDGTLWLWGENYLQRQGNGTPSFTATPVQVPGVTGAVSVAAGEHSAYALAADHTVWAVGDYVDFQLGSLDTARAVQHIAGLTGVVALAGADNAGFAVKSDGTAWSWGSNAAGLLGDDSSVLARATPAPIPGLTGVTAIAAAGTHALVLRADGTLLAWGSDYDGQLGDARSGASAQSGTPITMPRLTGVTALAAGTSDSYLVRSDGTVWSYGANAQGQLGNGGDPAGHGPAAVFGLGHVHQVAASRDAVFAVSG